MAAAPARVQPRLRERRDAAAADAERALLEAVRAWARAAQCAPRLDLDGACGLMSPAATPGAASAGVALLRALDSAALRPMAFHPRGAAAIAFGEAWTLRFVTALRDRDLASAAFLLRSGVRRERRRQVRSLAERLVDCLAAEPGGAGKTCAPILEPFQCSEPAFRQPAP